jgi:hypothetical protein
VANEIRIAVGASQFDVPVVGRQPRGDNFRDGDATVSKNQCAWRLLAAMACVALDVNGEEPLFMHPVTQMNVTISISSIWKVSETIAMTNPSNAGAGV